MVPGEAERRQQTLRGVSKHFGLAARRDLEGLNLGSE